ncbi:MAG: cyclic nucleotide-binding domain-containing protein [Aquificota bacterium]|nr:cyclic nucleotide-binding domain-containing protein [Aquificota bacterium]
MDFLHEGDVFGYPSLLSGDPPTSTAKVVQDAILYLLPKEVFLKLIEKYEEFELFFARSLAKKLSATVRMVKKPVRDVGSLERFLTMRVGDVRVSEVPCLEGKDSVLKASSDDEGQEHLLRLCQRSGEGNSYGEGYNQEGGR